MSEPAKAAVRVRDFEGIVLSTDSLDREPSQAAEQVNVVCTHEGQLRTRGGFRFVAFEDD